MTRVRLIAALLFVCAAAPPPDTSGLGFDPHLGARLPFDAVVRNEWGTAETLGVVARGLPVLLLLGYFRCPNLCGVARAEALAAVDLSGLRAGRDFSLIMLSIDPAETAADAVAAKQSALARFSATPGAAQWRFLTASHETIDAVSNAAGFRYRADPALGQFLHPAGLVILRPDGVIASYLLVVAYEPGALRSAVLRAGQGAIAQAISPVLLLCFHYDGETGRYTFAVYRALSVMAALTVLTVGTTLFVAHRRPRLPR